MDYILNTLINLVRSTPNDHDLGKKVRALIQPFINEQRPTSENKQLLKD